MIKKLKKTLPGITYTSGFLQTLPNTAATFSSTFLENYPPHKLPDIQLFGKMVIFYFEKGNYSMPLKQVKKYGYKASIVVAYIKAEKTNWFNYTALGSTWMPQTTSNIKYYTHIPPNITTTIGTITVGYTV